MEIKKCDVTDKWGSNRFHFCCALARRGKGRRAGWWDMGCSTGLGCTGCIEAK
jgi:hypothetical protein